jgi:endonuclease/exonuclease/phosphatase family metal-dependent hydrolase
MAPEVTIIVIFWQKWRFMKALIFLFVACLSVNEATAASTEIKLLNFNAGLLRVPGKGELVHEVDLRAQALPDRLSAFIQSQHPDIILLEEVWEDGHQQSVKSSLENLGYQVEIPLGQEGAFAPFTKESLISLIDVGYHGSTGLIVAWNTTTIQSLSNLVVDSYGPRNLIAYYEAGTAKGLVFGHFNMLSTGTPIFFLGVYSTAMDVNPKDGSILDSDDARQLQKVNLGQIELVSKIVKDNAHPNEVRVIMGDFNTGPGLADDNFNLLEKGLGLYSLMPAEGATWDRNNRLVKEGAYPNDPTSVIDHIFVGGTDKTSFEPKSSSLTFVNEKLGKAVSSFFGPNSMEYFPLSDHYGLFVTGTLTTDK